MNRGKTAKSKFRLFFAILYLVEVIGHNTGPDWPKLGPSMLIATALVVAIRTARWAAKAPGAGLSDVDADLDREVDFAGASCRPGTARPAQEASGTVSPAAGTDLRAR